MSCQPMHLVDSHCHINFEPLMQDIEGVLQRAQDNEVRHMLCVSVNLEDYPEVEALAARYSHVFSSVGVHPNYTDCHEPTSEELVELAKNKNVVAIGETGLDYFRNEGNLDWQRDRFNNHIEAAKIAHKPLIIHTREAADDTMSNARKRRCPTLWRGDALLFRELGGGRTRIGYRLLYFIFWHCHL